MSEAPRWDIDGMDWPNREYSRFVQADGLRWHVQRAGHGPTLLLLHGTGSASHSWRGLLPLLMPYFDVIAPDLPGHGFTQAPLGHRVAAQMSPHGMAAAVSALLESIEAKPVLAVGNSAGVVVLIRMVADQGFAPRAILGINAALLPFDGIPGAIFLPLARLFASTSLTASLLAWRASDRVAVEALIRGTGSVPDDWGVTLYQRLLRRPAHIASTLAMMANWALDDIERDLKASPVPIVLFVGLEDRAVPPAQAYRVQRMAPQVQVVEWAGLGHLAQEEQPEVVAQAILHQARRVDVLPVDAFI
jgi:magnesium chelatase accessory protein